MISALITVDARSNLWVWSRSLSIIPGSNLLWGNGSISSVFILYVANSATGRSLVQRSPNACVTECDRVQQ